MLLALQRWRAEQDLKRSCSKLHSVSERHSFGPPSPGCRTAPKMATVALRTAEEQEARKAAATDLLREIKLVFDDRPAVYLSLIHI